MSGTGETAAQDAAAAGLDPETARKLGSLRAALRENFGKAVMAMMALPRYRSQMLGDLQHLVLDPMIADRFAFAYPGKPEETVAGDMAGFAIWASVTPEVDARIREQIAQGVFPVRLKPGDWAAGEINWLLDVVAPDRATTSSVVANFRRLAKGGELRLHPGVLRLVDPETLERMGVRRASASARGAADA
jgi:hemolysin-activating ACP:hemolysin acyltransferase